MNTIKSALITAGNGKFKFCLDYSITNTSIIFQPWIEFTQPFTKDHTATVNWTNANGTKKEITKKIHAQTFGNVLVGKNYTNGDYSVKVTLKLNGTTTSLTITNNAKPPKPTLTAKRVNDNRFEITVTGNGYKTVPVTSVTLQRQDSVSTASWTTVATRSLGGETGSYSFVVTDQNTETGNRYRWRVSATNQSGSSGYATTAWTYTLPPAISTVTHERVSNTSVNLTWSRVQQQIDRYLITGYRLEQSINGGSWTVRSDSIGTGDPDTTSRTVSVSTVANKSYSFRLVPKNSAGISKSAYPADGTETTYNTPAAPASVKATWTATSGNVAVAWKIDEPSTATNLHIERKVGTGAWTELTDIELTAFSGTYTDTNVPAGTTIVYRARCQRDDSTLTEAEQYSKYITSTSVQTLAKPSKPTLNTPAKNGIITMDNTHALMSWTHNPTDGTAQTAAQIEYQELPDTTAHTVSLTTAAVYSFAISGYSANKQIKWRVRTKGSHSSYSDWSDYRIFTLRAIPEVHITSPENGETITELPIQLAYTYTDASGSLSKLTLKIYDGDKTIKTVDIPASTRSYSINDVLFENEKAYTLSVTAVSTTKLSATDEVAFSVQYVPVVLEEGVLFDIDYDSETGHALISISTDATESEETVDSPVDRSYLYRVYNGQRELIGADLHDGDQIEDIYAPLNASYSYELLSLAEDGSIALTAVETSNPSQYWFVYHGDETIRLMYDPNGSVRVGRPEKTLVRYSGREYPVSYDSSAIEQTYSLTTTVVGNELMNDLKRFIREGGQGVWKSCDGDVYLASFSLSYSADFTRTELIYKCTIDVTRIESEDL